MSNEDEIRELWIFVICLIIGLVAISFLLSIFIYDKIANGFCRNKGYGNAIQYRFNTNKNWFDYITCSEHLEKFTFDLSG